MVRLYQIFNMTVGEHGVPLSICDKHYKDWAGNLPKNLLVEKIANESLAGCNLCNQEQE